MTLQDIVSQAERQLNAVSMYKGPRKVSFLIPGRYPRNGNTKRLLGKNSPLGECVCEEVDGVLVAFDCYEVIAWAKSQKEWVDSQ